MRIRRMIRASLALLLVFTGAFAGEAAPDAATLLFEEPQLEATRPGDVLSYSYSRKTVDDAKFGPSFDDQIRLTVAAGDKPASRTLEVQLFSGGNRRPAGPFPNMTGNPILSLFLEHHVGRLSTQFYANSRYLKNAVRAGLRDKAEVTQTKIEVNGRSVAGWHVRMTPFRDDANKARMLGLDTLTYDFVGAKDVPGEIVEIRAFAPGPDGSTLLDERVLYDAKAN